MKMPTVPSVTFKTRVRNDAIEGPNPFEWKDLTSDEVFKGKRVVLFALPGAFTPTPLRFFPRTTVLLSPALRATGRGASTCQTLLRTAGAGSDAGVKPSSPIF